MAAYDVTTSNSILAISTNGTEVGLASVLMDANHSILISGNSVGSRRALSLSINTST